MENSEGLKNKWKYLEVLARIFWVCFSFKKRIVQQMNICTFLRTKKSKTFFGIGKWIQLRKEWADDLAKVMFFFYFFQIA